MTALDIACRTCGQQPKQPCIGTMFSGKQVPLIYTHAERIEDAAACTTNVDPVSVAAFDDAVEGSDLV